MVILWRGGGTSRRNGGDGRRMYLPTHACAVTTAISPRGCCQALATPPQGAHSQSVPSRRSVGGCSVAWRHERLSTSDTYTLTRRVIESPCLDNWGHSDAITARTHTVAPIAGRNITSNPTSLGRIRRASCRKTGSSWKPPMRAEQRLAISRAVAAGRSRSTCAHCR
jgi:hypothetical protein